MQVHSALRDTPLDPKMARWTSDDLFRLARTSQHRGKPMLLAANKADMVSREALQNLSKAAGYLVVPTSAEYELALRRAASAGVAVASKARTDWGNDFTRAMNGRTKMVGGRDHPGQDGDVLKIVAKV